MPGFFHWSLSLRDLHLEQCQWSRSRVRDSGLEEPMSKHPPRTPSRRTVRCWRQGQRDPMKVCTTHTWPKNVGRIACSQTGSGIGTATAPLWTVSCLASCDLQHSAPEKSASPDFTDFCISTTTHLDGPRRGQVLDDGSGATVDGVRSALLRGSVFSARRV